MLRPASSTGAAPGTGGDQEQPGPRPAAGRGLTWAMPRSACWWMDTGAEPLISPNAASPSVTQPAGQQAGAGGNAPIQLSPGPPPPESLQTALARHACSLLHALLARSAPAQQARGAAKQGGAASPASTLKCVSASSSLPMRRSALAATRRSDRATCGRQGSHPGTAPAWAPTGGLTAASPCRSRCAAAEAAKAAAGRSARSRASAPRGRARAGCAANAGRAPLQRGGQGSTEVF